VNYIVEKVDTDYFLAERLTRPEPPAIPGNHEGESGGGSHEAAR
jgi:hypothetical protein